MSTNDPPAIGIHHPTVVPSNAQSRMEEVHFILRGPELSNRLNESMEDAVAEQISDVLLENYGIYLDEIAVSHDGGQS